MVGICLRPLLDLALFTSTISIRRNALRICSAKAIIIRLGALIGMMTIWGSRVVAWMVMCSFMTCSIRRIHRLDLVIVILPKKVSILPGWLTSQVKNSMLQLQEMISISGGLQTQIQRLAVIQKLSLARLVTLLVVRHSLLVLVRKTNLVVSKSGRAPWRRSAKSKPTQKVSNA